MFQNTFENRFDRLRTLVYALAFMAIGFVFPWWSIILVAVMIGWVEHGLLRACMAALVSCFLAWFLLTFAFDLMNGLRISTRLGGLVGVPVPVVASLASATLGGLVAALAAGFANQLRVVTRLLRASR